MNLLPSLFSPIKIKSLDLVNRVVMPPMGTNLGNPDGTVSEANLAYMKRRARGGAGLIITEITLVHPSGSVIPNQLGIVRHFLLKNPLPLCINDAQQIIVAVKLRTCV